MVSGLVKLRTWAKPMRRMKVSTSGAEIEFVGVPAHPVVHVVAEFHAALALIVRDVSAKVAAGQTEPQAHQRGIDRARRALRPRRRRGVPALFTPPETAHAGAVIKRERDLAAARHHPRGALQRFVHRAGVVQHAPGIDHVEGAGGLRRELEHAELPDLGGNLRCMLSQHRPGGFHRDRIEIDRDDARGAEPRGGYRVQTRTAADVEKRFAGKPPLTEQTHESARGFGNARLVDDGGVARPVLPKGEMGGEVLERGRRGLWLGAHAKPSRPGRPSGPIPKFVSIRGTFRYELRNQRTTSNFMILVRF